MRKLLGARASVAAALVGGTVAAALGRGGAAEATVVALLILSAAIVAIAQQTLPWTPNAVYGIARSGSRNDENRGWAGPASIFALSCVAAGLTAGVGLGLLGVLLPIEPRTAVAALLAVAAGVAGAVELGGRKIMVLQCDRETPRRWVDQGAVRWAVKTGMALGVGGTTRIGFWLWFVVPLGAFLVGDVGAAVAIYGTYAVVRGLGPAGVILADKIASERRPPADAGWWLIRQAETARLVASAQLVLVAVAVAGIVGF